MTEPSPSPPAPEQPADWEGFYRDYRKPGYIDGFEITSKLGGGMFGLVFRARRMSIGKDYAIKFLKVDDGEVRRAVLSELEQVKYFAQIDHPNLVSIEDRGEVSGIPFLVMAFAGTETLRDKMTQSRIGDGEAPTAEQKGELVRAFLQACRGLQALHERSLVHFDIKPANVFMKGGVARLGDYGLSKLVTHSRGSLSMGRGTPYYMAPEMLQRRGDARSDIYSLGVMLYEILCGKVPFTGDSEWEVLRKHENASPELPTFLTAPERAVLQGCLAKDPQHRFQSVDAMLHAFGAPTSTAAAAWNDVQAGAGQAPPPPAPPPGSPPPPPPRSTAATDDDNPYKEVADASRKAFQHANKVARAAMSEAQQTARKAAKEAHAAWRKSWDRTRDYSVRRWRALTKLRKQKKDSGDRDRATKFAASIVIPAAEAKAPSRLRRVAWTMGGVVAVVMLVAVILLAVLAPTMRRSRSARADSDRRAWEAEAIASQQASLSSRQSGPATYRSFEIPREYSSLVTTSEPRWATLAHTSARDAKVQLTRWISKLRSKAPMRPGSRSRARLPEFTVAVEPSELAAIEIEISVLLGAKRYDSKLAKRLLKRGPVALALMGKRMARIPYEDSADLNKARRLHGLLVEATGCRDLSLVTRGSSSDLRKYNQPVGELWMWFVNEFAHTERTWQVYRNLLRL